MIFLPPPFLPHAIPRTLAKPGDIFGCCDREGRGSDRILASRGWRPGMLVNIPQCTGPSPRQKSIPATTSIVPKLRHPGLGGFFNCKMGRIIVSIKRFSTVPGPRDTVSTHQPLSLSHSDPPKPGCFCPGRDLPCLSRG